MHKTNFLKDSGKKLEFLNNILITNIKLIQSLESHTMTIVLGQSIISGHQALDKSVLQEYRT